MPPDCQWQPDWLWLHLPGLEQQWHELHSLPGPGGHPQLQTGLEWRFEWLHWQAGCSLHGQLPPTATNCHSTEELVLKDRSHGSVVGSLSALNCLAQVIGVFPVVVFVVIFVSNSGRH